MKSAAVSPPKTGNAAAGLVLCGQKRSENTDDSREPFEILHNQRIIQAEDDRVRAVTAVFPGSGFSYSKKRFRAAFFGKLFLFSRCFFAQSLDFDRIIFKKGVYCPMRCTSPGNTTFIFDADIDSDFIFDILNPEAREQLFSPSCRQIRSLKTE